jgi:hypothetical protein
LFPTLHVLPDSETAFPVEQYVWEEKPAHFHSCLNQKKNTTIQQTTRQPAFFFLTRVVLRSSQEQLGQDSFFFKTLETTENNRMQTFQSVISSGISVLDGTQNKSLEERRIVKRIGFDKDEQALNLVDFVLNRSPEKKVNPCFIHFPPPHPDTAHLLVPLRAQHAFAVLVARSLI